MTWSFLVDSNLPVALARALETAGNTAVHTTDLGMGDGDDTAIWALAADQGLVVVSKDSDFADLASAARQGTPVVWIRVGNTRRVAVIDKVIGLLPDILAELERGERLIEVR